MGDHRPTSTDLGTTSIGEHAARLSEEVIATLPGIPWRDIIGMRARIVHDYEGFDPDIARRTINEDLPRLRRAIRAHLDGG